MRSRSKNNVRRRGVILTDQGSRKLNQAKAEVESEYNFKRYTLEALSEETGLTSTTLSKIFTGSAGVDKGTLECCFNAFNLKLLKEDYLYLKPERDNFAEIGSMLLHQTRCPIKLACDRCNTHIILMDQTQDNLLPRPPTAPGGQMPLDSVFYLYRIVRAGASSLIHLGDKPTRTFSCPSYYFKAWSAIYFLIVSL